MKIVLGLLSLIVAACACSREPVTPPPQKGDCQAWCAHATQLNCDAAKPTQSGASCLDVCTNMLAGPAHIDTECRSRAATCEAADQCENAGITATASSATCEGWCKHAASLGCPAARPTPAGASCAEVCHNMQTGPARLNLSCRATARTCAAADACETRN